MLFGFEKTGAEAGGHGHRPALGQRVLHGNRGLFEDVASLGIDRAQVGFEHRSGLKVILKVLADPFGRNGYIDPMRFDLLRITNTRKHQYLRRPNCSRAQYTTSRRARSSVF